MALAPSSAELLDVWERGRELSPVNRALSLLSLAMTEIPIEQLAQWNIGRRDAELLKLRESLFGPRLLAQADCPGCGSQVELNFATADIRAEAPAENGESYVLESAGHELRFRLPNSLDLAAICSPTSTAPSDPVKRLLQRCLLSSRRGERAVAADQLPPEVILAVSRKMSEADPQGDVQLALDCPLCAHHWQAPLDIVAFLWSELHAWATRLLREVHTLASAYGWRESDILALSPLRRQAYLESIET